MANKNGVADERTLKLLDAALNLRQAGEPVRALDVLSQAEQEAPNYAPVHLLMGLAYRDIGKLDDAEAELRRAVDLNEESAEALQSLGLLLLSRGRPAEAIGHLKKHLLMQPNDPLTLNALTSELARAGRHEEALRILNDAWQKTGGVDAGITYGRYLMRVGQLTEAEVVLNKLAETSPEPRTLIEWAQALELLQKFQQAKNVLMQVTKSEPESDRAWRGLTKCQIRLGDFEAGLQAAERALAINDCSWQNWYAKGTALEAQQRYEEALEAYRKGMEVMPPDDPGTGPVVQLLRLRESEVLVRMGREEDALAVLDALRRQFPTEERCVFYQVIALNRQGKSAAALEVLDEAVAAGIPKDGGLAPLHYETLHLLGRPQEALEFIRPMLPTQKEYRLFTLTHTGVSLYRQGNIEPARLVFEQLLQIAPNKSRFMNNLAFILIGDGDLQRAEQLLAQALDAGDDPQMRAVILANLGYLCLVRQDIACAGQHLAEALAAADKNLSAILRVASWQDGKVQPSELAHPRDFIPVRQAASANLVTAALAEGHVDDAERLAGKMLEEAPESPWGYRMVGWVALAKGDSPGAQAMWRQGMKLTKGTEERQVLEHLLETLTP